MKILSNKEYERIINKKPQFYTYYTKDPYQAKKIEELEIQNIRLEIELEKKDKEIERLNNIIKRLEDDLREMYLTFGEFNEEYTENRIKELKGGDKG